MKHAIDAALNAALAAILPTASPEVALATLRSLAERYLLTPEHAQELIYRFQSLRSHYLTESFYLTLRSGYQITESSSAGEILQELTQAIVGESLQMFQTEGLTSWEPLIKAMADETLHVAQSMDQRTARALLYHYLSKNVETLVEQISHRPRASPPDSHDA